MPHETVREALSELTGIDLTSSSHIVRKDEEGSSSAKHGQRYRPKKGKAVRLKISISEAMKSAVAELAEQKGVTSSRIINEILEAEIDTTRYEA